MAALLTVAAVAALAVPTGSHTGQAAPADVEPARSHVDRMEWIDDVIDVVDKLIEALEGAEDEVHASMSSPAAMDAARLDALLVDAEILIDRVLNQGQYPSLDPERSGAVDTNVSPQSLAEYAEATVLLAYDALDEVLADPDFDHDFVGSSLRTIEHLIVRQSPHNYRTKAGIGQ